jgi:dUTP pyrophosphatase
MKVKFKKLVETAVTPSYAKPGDAGLDISAIAHKIDLDHNFIEYYTGIAFEVPDGHVGLLFPRSSVSKKDLSLANCVGVIDSGYRGEISFRYKFNPGEYFANVKRYEDGDRVGQLVIMPYPEIELEQVNDLAISSRGEGAYGSTGN